LQEPLQPFLEECFFPFVVHFTKFAENIITGAVPYVRTQSVLMCEQLLPVWAGRCACIRHGGTPVFLRDYSSRDFYARAQLLPGLAFGRIAISDA
jgi:hypothetical protein